MSSSRPKWKRIPKPHIAFWIRKCNTEVFYVYPIGAGTKHPPVLMGFDSNYRYHPGSWETQLRRAQRR